MALVAGPDLRDTSWAALGLAARVAVGLVFLMAGSSKLHFSGFSRVVMAAGVPERHAGLVAHLLPRCELALGILLILGVALPVTYWVVLGMLVGFTGLIVASLRRGISFNCGCFGSLSAPVGWPTVFRNVLLIGLVGMGINGAPAFAVWAIAHPSGSTAALPTADALAVAATASLVTIGCFVIDAAFRVRSMVTAFGRTRGA